MSNIEQYNTLKKQILGKEFARLNEMQRRAVYKVTGPVLILAGAGSGKTTVLVNRIANLVRFGRASETTTPPCTITDDDLAFLAHYAAGRSQDNERMVSLLADEPAKPWSVLAITFTNKAAGELKARLEAMLGAVGRDINAATFHSACAKILRREIDRLGYTGSFTIYDTDDSLRVIKEALRAQNIDEKQFTPRSLLSAISAAKNQMTSANSAFPHSGDYFGQMAAKVYDHYRKALKAANALDFDDIILLTVQLFEEHPDVLEKYRRLYRYIMVDEYQDTNHMQYRLISLLAAGHKNICVVGDDDQSIYKFRGATIENILSFESQFTGAEVVRLEENYRCTGNILEAANHVIANNTQRKGKTLWTQNPSGDPITVYRARDEQSEAAFVARTIAESVEKGARYIDHAVLYRLNAQSNALEQSFIRFGIPYRILGGLRFFERKEIKDMLAYLCVANNPADRLRLLRIINEPKRGIGAATLETAEQIASMLGLTLYEVIAQADQYPLLSKKSQPLMAFAAMMEPIIEGAQDRPPEETFHMLLERSGYLESLRTQGFEGQTRIENIEELGSSIIKYSQETETPTLSGFLEEVALYTDLDNYDPDADAVVLMTLHSAKGLEFPVVFIPGLEEGIFPGMQAIYNPPEIEEERRLAYVGLTRAKQQLYLSCSGERMLFGRTGRNRPSRFIGELPSSLVVHREDESLVRSNARPLASTAATTPYRGGTPAAAAPTAASSSPELSPGDQVAHRVFGNGMVLSVTPMGGDRLVEIAFEKVGTKRIMANMAKLTKL